MSDSSFSHKQIENIYPPGIEYHYWNFSRNRIIKSFIKKNGIEGNKLLEVGCGKGIVVEYLRKNGLNIYGAELCDAKPSDSEMSNYLFFNTDALALPQNFREGIDFILLLDVLEHVEAPEFFINQLQDSYPNLKGFVITVPARQELFSNYDKYNGHYLRYSRKKLIQLVEKTGMKPFKISYLYHGLYLPAFFVKLVYKRNTNLKAPRGIMLIFHKLAAFFFILEYKIMLSKLWGTSLICLSKIN